MEAKMSFDGGVSAKVIRKQVDAPLAWKIRNWLRPGFWFGWLMVWLAKGFSKVSGIATMTSSLRLQVITASGQVIDYGVVCYRLVTTAGVNWLVDCWQGTLEPETMKYHGCGTGGTAEADHQRERCDYI